MEHLLRTLAAVHPSARVLHLGCGDGRTTADLARLGFDVWACTSGETAPARERLGAVLGAPEAERRVTRADAHALGYPDAEFDWVAAHLDARDTQIEALIEIRRVLRPGAWAWVALADDTATPEALALLAARAGLVIAETPIETEHEGRRVLRGIFRRVGAGVTD